MGGEGGRGRAKKLVLALTGLLAVAGVIAWVLLRPRPTAAMRGEGVAHRMGCFACHGAGGLRGAPNPGAKAGSVPSWDPAEFARLVKNEAEIREWILYGAPRRAWIDGKKPVERPAPSDAGLLAMPPYDGRLTDAELSDLVAYLQAVSGFPPAPDPQVRAGWQAAAEFGCFACHGPGGRVGAPNPGSLKGYVPPWTGPDFAALVRDDAELEQWILDGGIERLREDPAAQHFLQRQVLRMPAYASTIPRDQLSAIMAYIRALPQAP